MIHPNMATMLAHSHDARISRGRQTALSQAVNKSFNMITVVETRARMTTPGHCQRMKAGCPEILVDTPEFEAFSAA